MEDTRYYTPDISEFHVGFEFEHNNTWGDWTKHVLTEDMLKNPFRYIPLGSGNERTNYWDGARIKYLDKDDLNSIGFSHTNNVDSLSGYEFDSYCIEAKYNKVITIVPSNIDNGKLHIGINIYQNSYKSSYSYGELIFSGIVKNKSELIKLLIQLGIYARD